MALRCIYCSRSEKQVQLSGSFACVDRKDCDKTIADKNTPIITVCIYFDCACMGANAAGGCPLGVAVATFIAGEYQEQWSGIKAVKWGSNNDGEFIGLLYALSVAWLMRQASPKYVFKIFGDSQIIINMFNDVYKSKGKFATYKAKSVRLKHKLGMSLLSVSWVPRSQNKEADKLSKEALLLHRQ